MTQTPAPAPPEPQTPSSTQYYYYTSVQRQKPGFGFSQIGISGAMLFTLLIVSNASNGNLYKIWTAASSKSSSTSQDYSSVREYLIVGAGEFVFIIVLLMIAQSSDTASNMVLMLSIVLWVIWIVKNNATFNSWVNYVQGKSTTKNG